MKYIALDIEGWLSGTVARFLTKAEKAIWSNLITLGGKGKGRIGYIEFEKYIPYTRQQLLTLCECFIEDDIKSFDSCMYKCLNGINEDGRVVDMPRLIKDDYGSYEIINWDSYQHSDYPKGFTEDEAKQIKKAKITPEEAMSMKFFDRVRTEVKETVVTTMTEEFSKHEQNN